MGAACPLLLLGMISVVEREVSDGAGNRALCGVGMAGLPLCAPLVINTEMCFA